MWPVVVCAGAVAGLLAAQRRESPLGVWIAKPLAALSFIAAALSWGALDTGYGRGISIGLVLCACGDVLLIPRGRSRWFQIGIAAFRGAVVDEGSSGPSRADSAATRCMR